jgi:hypothetical protein
LTADVKILALTHISNSLGTINRWRSFVIGPDAAVS